GAGGISVAAVAAVILALAGLAALRRGAGEGLGARLADAAYVWALSFGHVARSSWRAPAPRRTASEAPAPLLAGSEGVAS
ncbi:MAG: hypothetical protein ACM3NV_00180, partial [Syntrophothermus sp.]